MPNETPKLDWNTRLVAWFLGNTRLVIMLFLGLVLGGAFSYAGLRSEGFPSPEIKIGIITSSYPGASAAEVEDQVVKPLEASVQGVSGLNDLSATASTGFAVLTATFDASADFKSAMADLRAKVQDVQLPKDANKPDVTVPSFGGSDSYFAITKPGVSAASLRTVGETVRAELEAIPGVKDFKLQSDLTDQVEVRWHTADLASHGVTLVQLQQALAAGNVSIPAGSVNLDTHVATVVTDASVTSADQIKAILLAPGVKVSDVADVVQVATSKDSIQDIGLRANSQVTTQPALIYKLELKSDADLLQVADKTASALATLKSGSSLQGAQVVTVYDSAAQVSKQVKEIREGAIGGPLGSGSAANLGYLLGGVWLVVLVMLIFVNWRVALVSALVIPLSLLFTFLSLRVMGITLNTLTLFSLILVLGLVVDPAVVVLEAVQREIDLGRKGADAVLTAVMGIGNGVFMAALTSIIVFVPFGVVSGVFGQIIRYIPLTVVPALLASYFVPLFFLTYVSSKFLKPAHSGKNEEEVLWSSSKWFIRVNRKILSSKWYQVPIIVAGIIVPLAVSGALFATKKVVPVQFSSAPDVDQLTLTVSYPANLTQTEKAAIFAKVDPILEAEKSVNTYFPLSQSSSGVSILVNLLPRDQRDSNSPAIVDRLNTNLSSVTNSSQKVFAEIAANEVGPPTSDFPVQVNIYGDNLANLKKAAIQTGDLLRARPEVTRVEDGFTGIDNPQVEVSVDRAKAAASGLSGIQVAQELSGLLGQAQVTKFTASLDGAERSDQVLLVNAAQPTSVDQVSNEVLGVSPLGKPVKVRDIATVSLTQGFTGINRLNGSRYVTVKAQVKDAMKDAAAPQQAVKDYWTASRLESVGLRSNALEDKGSGNEFIQSFKDLFIALGVSILLTYVTLALFFGSFSQPFIILFAVPLSFLGVFPALTLVGGQFGFLEILGIITLVGIVENVGIFVIDLANRKRKEGVEYREAIAEATGIRFRPIFLTKVTALGGLLPLIIVSPFWRSLAVVVVAGILTSGVLSLFTTPILYAWLIEFKGWLLKPRRRRRA